MTGFPCALANCFNSLSRLRSRSCIRLSRHRTGASRATRMSNGVAVSCLYQSETDWKPADGMYGFIARLDSWVRDAAQNNLDPDDVALHPPVAYATGDRLVVPRVDTPLVEASTWIGFAELRQRSHRTEIVGWKSFSSVTPRALRPGDSPA